MANISKELQDIKKATFGEEVRGSIHDGIEKINEGTMQDIKDVRNIVKERMDNQDSNIGEIDEKVNANIEKQEALEEKFNEQIKNMTLQDPSSAEIVEARGGFSLLSKRLENIDTKLNDLEKEEKGTSILATTLERIWKNNRTRWKYNRSRRRRKKPR